MDKSNCITLDWFVARNKNGDLWLYENDSVVKLENVWAGKFCLKPLPKGSFPEVKWADETPTQVKVTIEL